MSLEAVSVSIGNPPANVTTIVQALGLAVTFGLGIFNLFWAAHLSRKNRRLSVDDEFWFRKVIAPLVIDGSIEFCHTWSKKLVAASSKRGDKKGTQQLVAECKASAGELMNRCLCLKLYGPGSYTHASSKIDAVVDEVTEKLYAVSSPAVSAPDAQKLVKRGAEEIGVHLVELLGGLKRLQSKV